MGFLKFLMALSLSFVTLHALAEDELGVATECRSLLVASERPNFLPKAAEFLRPLLGRKVLIELTTEELAEFSGKIEARLNSVTGSIVEAKLVDYNISSLHPQITIKIGRKLHTLSVFIKADSAEALGQKALEQFRVGEELSNVYRLRDVQMAEDLFDSNSVGKLRAEIEGVINGLAHEEELRTITDGKRGWRLMQKLSGVYGERTWVDREMLRVELARYVRRGNLNDAAGKYQGIFTRVETATILLLRLRPLYEALERLETEQPAVALQMAGLKAKMAKVMDKHAQILGWEYGDYRALRAELNSLIRGENESTEAKKLQLEITENTYEGVQSLLTRLGVHRIAQTHFPLLFRNEINLDSESAVTWVSRAYYGEPNPGSQRPPYASMLPRKATIHRYAFDQKVSALMNAMTHPVILNLLLKPVDAIPSHPAIVARTNKSTSVVGRTASFIKQSFAVLGHVPREYLSWTLEFLRDRRSRYVHGPGMLVIKQQMANKRISYDMLSAFMNEAARYGRGSNAFLVTAARDPEFGGQAWVKLRNYLKTIIEKDKTKTEVLVQFHKYMLDAEVQAAKLGPLSTHPVSGIDFIMKSGGTYVAFEMSLKMLEWLNGLGVLP